MGLFDNSKPNDHQSVDLQKHAMNSSNKVIVKWEDGDEEEFYGKITGVDTDIITIHDEESGRFCYVFRNSENKVAFVYEVLE